MATVLPFDTSPYSSTGIFYIPYLKSDVTAVVDIVKASSESSALITALVLNDEVNTNESFERSQHLLKEVLQRELVEKASGTIEPKLSRYAGLIFLVEDGRLFLDHENGLPVFRPGHVDDSILSLQAKVSQVLIQSAKEEAGVEHSPLVSDQLLKRVLGNHGTVMEEGALLTSKVEVNTYHDCQNETLLGAFIRAAECTTNDQLLEGKAEQQKERCIIEEKLDIEITDLQTNENRLKDLEEGELFEVGTFIEKNSGLQDYLDRYELFKPKEENYSIAYLSNLKEQRLRFEAIIKTNEGDRAETQTEIDQHKKMDSINHSCEQEKSISFGAKEDMQDKMEEGRQKQAFYDRKEKRKSLMRNEFETTSTRNISVEYSEALLTMIEMEVKMGIEQESAQNQTLTMNIELKREHNDASKPEDWDDEIHRRFVEAVLKEGMKTCSPSVLIDQMHFKADYITSERVKSHLQKFRRNKAKSVANFLDPNDVAIDTYSHQKKDHSCSNHDKELSNAELDRITSTKLIPQKLVQLKSGEVAAYLSHADRGTPESSLPQQGLERFASIRPPDLTKYMDGNKQR